MLPSQCTPMASPTPKRTPQPAPPTEDVDPRWLLKALAITLAVAFVFAYTSVCYLIYQGGMAAAPLS